MRLPSVPPSGTTSPGSLREFGGAPTRPLPVIVLADISGSMGENGKIQALNQALRDMIDALGQENDLRAQILLTVMTFGGGQARVAIPMTPPRQVSWTDLGASGNTPLGACLTVVREMLEDRGTLPERAYRPTLVLVSDGQPTDSWQEPLRALLASERGGRAFRMALAIGDDADLQVLEAFLADPNSKVMRASEAHQIRSFFRYVTMSVVLRSKSTTPNQPAPLPPEEWDL